ncbi:MAG: universal stress protein [Vulcanimicrobiaceae bacterium]
MMFRNILVAIDESSQSAAALDLAIELAKTLNGTITLVHALDPGSIASTADDAGAASVMEIELDELQSAGKELLEAMGQRVRAAGLEVETIVRDGLPAQTIVDTATRANCDLIVMGTHGRHGIERFFLGSCAEAVLRESPIPVLVKRS